MPACLPEQLWPSLPSGRPSCRPFSRSSTRRAGAREHQPHRGELRGLRTVRGARDRDLLIGQVVVALDERDRLDRLRRRAEEERQLAGRPSYAPSVVATWTRCTASTTFPRLTSTAIALHRGNLVPWRCRRRGTPAAATSTSPIRSSVTARVDLLWIPGFAQHLELAWEEPYRRAWLEQLARSIG